MSKMLMVAALTLTFAMPAHAFKAAFIDMQAAIQATSAGKNAKKKLEKEFNKKKDELKKKEGKIKKEAEEFEKKQMVLSEKVRNECLYTKGTPSKNVLRLPLNLNHKIDRVYRSTVLAVWNNAPSLQQGVVPHYEIVIWFV